MAKKVQHSSCQKLRTPSLVADMISNYSMPLPTKVDNSSSSYLRLPLVYSPMYNIRFWGIEKLHYFDVNKWGKVANFVIEQLQSAFGVENKDAIQFFEPNHPITDTELAPVHDEQFVANLKFHGTVVRTSEVCLLYFMPMRCIESHLLTPLRYQTLGTILACLVALKHKFAINIGGGFHHCSAVRPSGFCFFADITLTIRYLWNYCRLQALPMAYILILDCDAHQGNGYCRDLKYMTQAEQNHVYICDLYNDRIYPRDNAAKAFIDREVRLPVGVEDEEYLHLLQYHLNAVREIDKYKPDIIIYNAGTDVLRGDPLGRLRISANGIIQRDQMVFSFAKEHNIPIMMLLSGGYQRSNARVIADSILNLFNRELLKPININDDILQSLPS